MLLISGRFGLVLVLFAVVLWFGRSRFEALAALPNEADQIVTLLAFYGFATVVVAFIARSARAAWQFMAHDDPAD
jgi:hypothetical protein